MFVQYQCLVSHCTAATQVCPIAPFLLSFVDVGFPEQQNQKAGEVNKGINVD